MLIETKQRFLDVATAITANYSGDVVSSSRLSRKAEDYAEATDLQDREINEWQEKTKATTKAIYDIHDSNLQTVLELYYIQRLSWDQVAEVMHFSKSYILQHLHPSALRVFVIPQKYCNK